MLIVYVDGGTISVVWIVLISFHLHRLLGDMLCKPIDPVQNKLFWATHFKSVNSKHLII